jgi:hypothetical protein
MTDRPPGDFEMAIFRVLKRVPVHRRELEEERDPDSPPPSDGFLALNSLVNLTWLLDLVIAYMAKDEDTRAELTEASKHAAERVPAWMEMRVFGPGDKPEHKFVLGLTQLLADQRATIERLVDEQVENPEPIVRYLAEYPLPSGTEGEDTEELLLVAGPAMEANFQSALLIARELDDWVEEERERLD